MIDPPMRIRHLSPETEDYPFRINKRLRTDAPPPLTVLGNASLLRLSLSGLISSADTPADLILPTLDLIVEARRNSLPLIAGFQSSLERTCLAILLRGDAPLVVCPARSINGTKVGLSWREPLQAGRMLVVSRFQNGAKRPSVRLGILRNELVAALADRLLVIHAGSGSRAFRTSVMALEHGIPLYCFDHPKNRDLLLLGAERLDTESFCRHHAAGDSGRF